MPLIDYRSFGRSGNLLGRFGNLPGGTPPGGSPPSNTIAPVISGNQQVAQTLTTTDGTWDNVPTSFTYQWKRDAVSIGSATNNTYLLVELDAGAAITCEVTAHNASGDSPAVASNSLTIDVLVVFLAHIEDPVDATTFSAGVWNAVSFGTAAANRKICLGLSGRSGSAACDWSSGTINGTASAIVTDGVTAANARNTTSGCNFSTLVIADIPTGTSGNLSNTFSQSVVRINAGVWAIYGATTTQAATSGVSLANNPTSTQTIPAGGSAIGCSFTSNGATTSTATGLTEDYDVIVEVGAMTGGNLNTHAGGSTAMTFTWTTASNSSGAFVSWAP